MRVHDVREDPTYIPDQLRGLSELAVPLVFEDRVIGVIDSESSEAASIPAIVMSGYSSDPILADHEAHGFQGKVLKPFTLEDLSEAVSQGLA